MIYVATCPICGIYTRVEDAQPYSCCGCRVPYDLVPETPVEPPPPEEPPSGAE